MGRFRYGGIMWDRIQRLHEHHGDVPLEIRILKITEEVGSWTKSPTSSSRRRWP
jgi:hypothetical protein